MQKIPTTQKKMSQWNFRIIQNTQCKGIKFWKNKVIKSSIEKTDKNGNRESEIRISAKTDECDTEFIGEILEGEGQIDESVESRVFEEN